MRHDLRLEGARHRLRPVTLDDAAFIVDQRKEGDRTRYLHAVPFDVGRQKEWIERYFERPGDYYFVIERSSDGQPVGLVGIYDVEAEQAEWGRWIVTPDSVAAIPSAILIYDVAFDLLKLQRVYCRTIAENAAVVSFHDSFGARRLATAPPRFEIAGESYDAVEHEILRDDWAGIRSRVIVLAERLVARR